MRHLLVSLVLFSLCTMAGCPQDGQTSLDVPSNVTMDDSIDPDGGADASLDRFAEKALAGPGFTMTVPAGFALISDATEQPGVEFHRSYSDALGFEFVTVQVMQPVTGGPSAGLDTVDLRIKGTQVSGSGDLLLLNQIDTTDGVAEVDGAVAVLADGRTLVVTIGSQNRDSRQEVIAFGIFASIDLADTDGRQIETNWLNTAPVVKAVTEGGTVILDDGSAWSLYSNSPPEDAALVDGWAVGDVAFPQSNGRGAVELMKVTQWVPVDVYALDEIETLTVTELDGASATFSDGSTWQFSAETVAAWQSGDEAYFVRDNGFTWWVHGAADDELFGAQRRVVGPGFAMTLPPGDLEDISDEAVMPGATFAKTFLAPDGRAVVVGTIPVLQSSFTGGSSTDGWVTGAVITATGEELIAVALQQGDAVVDSVVAILQNGQAFNAAVNRAPFQEGPDLATLTMFASIELDSPDRVALYDLFRDPAYQVLVNADNGMLVRGDLSVWETRFSATPTQQLEFAGWKTGDYAFEQTRPVFGVDRTELVKVGSWGPVESEFVGLATELTIAEKIDSQTIVLSDGSIWGFSLGVPATFLVGDTVFIVEDTFDDALIHARTGRAY